MEEKVIKMNTDKKVDTVKGKLSYEELENIAHQLSNQNKQLYSQLQAVSMENMFKRLDYLFKVLEFTKSFNSDFVIACSEEIQEMLTIPEESKSETPEED